MARFHLLIDASGNDYFACPHACLSNNAINGTSLLHVPFWFVTCSIICGKTNVSNITFIALSGKGRWTNRQKSFRKAFISLLHSICYLAELVSNFNGNPLIKIALERAPISALSEVCPLKRSLYF